MALFVASLTGFQHTATRRWLHCSTKWFHYAAKFQHTATRRWLLKQKYSIRKQNKKFQHTATRRWLRALLTSLSDVLTFQHTATRRWLRLLTEPMLTSCDVSTHSHPKVAAFGIPFLHPKGNSFNTQPPEGGCFVKARFKFCDFLFQHTATRRWLPLSRSLPSPLATVSTHSHPKVAAQDLSLVALPSVVSTHSHPKVAALIRHATGASVFCFNTQPPEGGCYRSRCFVHSDTWFQHTATRRWLLPT